MTIAGSLWLALSTAIFLSAAAAAKWWTFAPSLPKILLTLALYSAGNLIMLRLVRDFGMGVAFSLSAVIQLIAVNVMALAFFGERIDAWQASGMVAAVVAVGLISFGPYLSGR